MEPMQERTEEGGNGRAHDSVGELLRRISDDVRVIAKDEVELARVELATGTKKTAADVAVIALAGIVAFFGLGLLCLSAVAALGAVIEPLWARLLIMAAVYLVVGGLVAFLFARRIKRDLPTFDRTAGEAKETARMVREEIHHA